MPVLPLDMAREQQATVILSDVSWENYNRFVEETMDKFVNPRICFEEGNLLIMTVSAEHEYYNRLIAALIDILAEMFEIPWTSLGSATYRKDDIERKGLNRIRVSILQTNQKFAASSGSI